MSHVTTLTRFFLSNQFLTSINENNINGTGGKVAHAYATLMKDNHTSAVDYENRIHHLRDSNAVTLDQCFESFTQPKRLDDDNMWYCSQCKEHVKL